MSATETGQTPFEAFYVAESARLFRSMLLLTGNRAEAEDLTHEAFVRVLERWPSVSRMEAPNAYLFRTAMNLESNRVRRILRRARGFSDDHEVEQDFSPEATARADLVVALQRLSREQREAVVLVDLIGFTSEEAGRMVAVTSDAVRARLHRARTALRKELMVDD